MTWWTRAVVFVKEVQLELKKVTWPTRNEVIGTTGVVLVIVFVFAIFLYGADLIFGKMVTHFLGIN